ncbi:MAG: glycosyltransferase family 4 protein [Nitrospirae bacterium]|nr:glycosyltransferase family 4 protein [Nitrospirota bacterium]
MSEKIKILHIFNSFFVGGMESNLLNFFNNADFSRFDHYIFVTQDEGPLKELFHKLPIKIITLKCTPKRYFYCLPVGYYFCKKNRINIIHGHNYWLYRYAYFLSILTKIPLFTSNYGLGKWKKKWDLFLESRIFSRARINIAISNVVLEKEISLVKKIDNPGRKFKLVYPIIKDISEKNLLMYNKEVIKQKLGITNDKPVLTIIGRIDRLKGHRLALDAVGKINQDAIKVNLLIVGPMSDPTVFKENDFDKEYIRYLNYYEQLEEIWAISDFFLISSISEGTPLVLVEYFAIGKPVIASDISGNKELIKDNWNGFLFKAGDVDSLVERIKSVIENKNIHEIQNNARKYYLDNLLPEKLVQDIEGYYSDEYLAAAP